MTKSMQKQPLENSLQLFYLQKNVVLTMKSKCQQQQKT